MFLYSHPGTRIRHCTACVCCTHCHLGYRVIDTNANVFQKVFVLTGLSEVQLICMIVSPRLLVFHLPRVFCVSLRPFFHDERVENDIRYFQYRLQQAVLYTREYLRNALKVAAISFFAYMHDLSPIVPNGN